MFEIDPKTISTKDLHQYLLASVAPRPIAFVSTVDKDGNKNLAPFSFFNAFSSNPPILVFSSNRRVENNTTKDTLRNVIDTKECVINVVSHKIVRQMTLASIEYDSSISEFEKAGLTPIPSKLVKPFRVAESPVQMECKVEDIIALGKEGGAGHLIICNVVWMHIDPFVLDDENRIDVHKIDLMGRMGRAFYTRASGSSISKINQPFKQMGVGFDTLPLSIKANPYLRGNQIAEIAALEEFPGAEFVSNYLTKDEQYLRLKGEGNFETLSAYAGLLIGEGKIREAYAILKDI
jgi:flavin reductase (DIM6/NTAB) family NADH-FMN oxidoreductase RutF